MMYKHKVLLVKNNNDFNRVEELVEKFIKLIPNVNLFDNYNHRTFRIEIIIKELWPDFVLNKKRNKEDATCPSLNLKKIEVKTKNYKNNNSKELTMFNSRFMFDKQDRESRREYILGFDALVFGIFINEKLHWLCWSNNEDVLEQYRNLVLKKQNEFIKYWEEKQKRKDQNGGNDAIQISLSEFNEESVWNFYLESKIYKDIKLSEIKNILGIQNTK